MADVELDVEVDTEADDDAQKALAGLEAQMRAIQGAARGMRGTFDQVGKRITDTGRRLPGLGARQQLGITADDLVPAMSQSSVETRLRPLVSAYDRVFGYLRGVVNRSATARGGMTGHAGTPAVSEFGALGGKVRGGLGWIDDIAPKIFGVRGALSGLSGPLQGIAGPLSGLLGMLGGPAGIASSLMSIASIAAKAFAAIAAGSAMAGLAVGGLLAQQVMSAAMIRERAVAAFDALVGSGEASFARIQQLSLQMGTSVQDSFEGIQAFLAAGFKMDDAERWFKRMQDLSLIGITEETRKRIVLAMSQIKGAGQLQGDELRQLQETGINVGTIWEEISKQMGVSVAEAKKLKEQGKVGSDVALVAIERAVQKLTGGGEAGTARKKFLDSTIQGSFERMKSVAAFNISEVASKAAPAWERLRGIMNEISDALSSDGTKAYTKALGEGFLAAGRGIEKAWQGLKKLASGFDDVMRNEGGLVAINQLMRGMFGDSDKADLTAEAFYNIGRAAAYMTVGIVAVSAAIERMIALLDQLSTYSADNPIMRALAGGTMGGEAGDLWQNRNRPITASEWLLGKGQTERQEPAQKGVGNTGIGRQLEGLWNSSMPSFSFDGLTSSMPSMQGLAGSISGLMADVPGGTINVANANITGLDLAVPAPTPTMPVETPAFDGMMKPFGQDIMRSAPLFGMPAMPELSPMFPGVLPSISAPPPALPGSAPVRPVSVPAPQGLDFSGILQSITGLSGNGERGERKTEVTVNISVQGAGPNADEEWERLAPHVRREVQVAIRSAGGV